MADQLLVDRELLESLLELDEGYGCAYDRLRALLYGPPHDLIPPRTIDLMDQMVVVVLEGDPFGKRRPRFTTIGGFVQTYTEKKTAEYEQLIQEEVLRIIGGDVLVQNTKQIKRRTFIEAYTDMGGRPLFTCPVRVEMEIRHPIRVSWSKSKTAGALNGSIGCTVMPDIDNVIKIWFDGMNKCMWKDDTQVVGLHAIKIFAEEPSVLVRVIPLDLVNA